MKDVPVESGEEEGAVAANWAAERKTELVLLARGPHVEAGGTSVKSAIPHVVKPRAVEFIGA